MKLTKKKKNSKILTTIKITPKKSTKKPKNSIQPKKTKKTS